MTDRYVRSTDGSDSDDGSTWALAKATLAGVAAIDAAGDRIFVSDNHAESTASAVSLVFAGTAASPTQIICGDDSAEPPTAVSEAGAVSSTGASSHITFDGFLFCHGLTITAGATTDAADIRLGQAGGNQLQKYRSCDFIIGGSGGARLRITNGSATNKVELSDCGIRFGAATQGLVCPGDFMWRGGSILSGGVAPSNLILQSGGVTLIDGVDLSNGATGMNLVVPSATAGRTVFRNCKLPASWSGGLVNASPTGAARIEMHNCDSGDTNYKLWVETLAGAIKDETTLVKTGGASDGDTPLSWKMATSANAEYPLHVLRSPEIAVPITSVGASKTITVDILHDSATALKDDEIWIEVQYLGTSGFPLSLFADDAKADVLAAAADQAASAATWTTTGMSNPNEQKLEVSFTPQEKGVALVTVCIAKASYTAYVDPVAQVS